MNQRRFGLRAASGLSLFLAVAVFALMALLTVVLGAGVYRSVVGRAEVNHEARTAMAYVTGKLRANTGDVSLEQTEVGDDMLVLSEEIGGANYETRIYAHEGTLYEIFAAAEIDFAPDQGQPIAALEAFSAEKEENALRLTVRAGGEDYTARVALWE